VVLISLFEALCRCVRIEVYKAIVLARKQWNKEEA